MNFGFPLFEPKYFKGLKLKGKKIRIFNIIKYKRSKYLVFEGEYKNGGINGIGKEYNTDGKIIYEGEYRNGERHGIGKDFDYTFFFRMFKGEYKNDERFKGKEYIEGKIIYDGEYKNNEKNDKGIIYYNKGDPRIKIPYSYGNFEGEIVNGFAIKGKMTFYYTGGKLGYIGELINGHETGEIKEYRPDGKLMFEGEYINEILYGKEYNSEEELLFAGRYNCGRKRWNGKGKEYNYKGELTFDGEYFEGKKWNGKMKEFFSKRDLNEELIVEGE